MTEQGLIDPMKLSIILQNLDVLKLKNISMTYSDNYKERIDLIEKLIKAEGENDAKRNRSCP